MATVKNSTDSSSLAEVVDRILDKGVVIDVWAKVSLVGIELLSIEARVVIASVETYLKYAEAIGLTAPMAPSASLSFSASSSATTATATETLKPAHTHAK
jgi:gas vesicle structural protein